MSSAADRLLAAQQGHAKLRDVLRNVPADGATSVIASIPVNEAKIYRFRFTFVARDNAAGTGAVNQRRVCVQGAAAPALIGADTSDFAVSSIGVPPTFVLALNGANLECRVTNPGGGGVVVDAFVMLDDVVITF